MTDIADAGNAEIPEDNLQTTGEFEEIEYEFNKDESNLYQHAKSELDLVGLLDEDADYGGALGKAVLELIETFARQGHSGYSAQATLLLFNRLASFQPLGDITDNPDEWTDVGDFSGFPHWQNKRRSTTFSRDGGKTWYDIEDASRNNGDTWFTEEETKKYLDDFGLDYNPDIVLDGQVKARLWDELAEMQRAYAQAHDETIEEGSLIVDPEHNRKVRAWVAENG